MTGEEQNVVSMVERSRARDEAQINDLLEYWKTLLNQGDLPARSEIEPRRIEHLLEYAFIGERVTDRLAKLRVAGSHLSDLAGMPVSGMPIATMFTQSAREYLADATEKLFTTPAVIRLDMRARGSVWAEEMRGQMILLPLRSDLGDITRALGAMVTQGRIGRTPRRFDIKRVVVTPIDLSAPVTTPAVPPVTVRRPAPAPVDVAASVPRRARPMPDLRPDRGARPAGPKLRLVVCND
ncbi:MAG: PAS domain-containing protein [Roseivivax sp.]|nr:PAS domain-containing protein [Roseivivax sp.]